jgi:hypothetical protein
MSVDLPDPEAPIRATNSPGRTDRRRLFKTGFWRRNDFEISLIVMADIMTASTS